MCACVSVFGVNCIPPLSFQLSNQGPESKQCTARGPCLSNLQLHSYSKMTHNYKPSQKLSLQSAMQKKIIGYPAKRNSSVVLPFLQCPFSFLKLYTLIAIEVAFFFLKKYVPLLLCNGLATMHTNTCWLDILVCHIMVILLGFLFKTTTTGSYFRAKELCRYRLRQDIPSSPKTSTVPARAIPRSPAMRAKWRGPLFKACKMPSQFNYVALGGTQRLLPSLCFNISAFSVAQACNILVSTERSEARRISEPGLQHSWISEQCGDLIA